MTNEEPNVTATTIATATAATASATMQAAVQGRYGSPDVIEIRSLPRPVATDGHVVVRVRAASVNAYDWHVLRGHPHLVRLTDGLRRPRHLIAGVDFAGVIETVGPGVTGFHPGDAVFGEAPGAFAEHVVARAERLVAKPDGLSFEAAAALPMAGGTALLGLRDKGRLARGQRVFITGAGGGVGTFAVQIARAMGGQVTALTGPDHVALVASLGADRVVDRSRESVSPGRDRFDLILDVSGTGSLTDLRRLLEPDGTLVLVGPGRGQWIGPLVRPLAAAIRTRLGGPRLAPFLASYRAEDMRTLVDMTVDGALTPVIDRVVPLRDTAAAIRHVESGRAAGKVVIAP